MINNQSEIIKFLMGYTTKFDFTLFSKSRINILSEEGLTTGFDLSSDNISRDKFLIRSKILEMKHLLENYYNEQVDILLIFVIRNQSDLLESLYIELYSSCFSLINDLNTPDKFVKNMKKYKDFFDWFDYYETINFFYEKLNCKVFLFENWQENTDFFKIFGEKYSNTVMNKKYNVKRSKEVIKSTSIGIALANILKEIKILNLLFYLKKRNNTIDKFITKCFNCLNNIKIEGNKMAFSKENKEKVMEYYKSKNKLLINFFPEKELKKYNYF